MKKEVRFWNHDADILSMAADEGKHINSASVEQGWERLKINY